MTNNAEREGFERWANTQKRSLDRDPDGDYSNDETNSDWYVWQSAFLVGVHYAAGVLDGWRLVPEKFSISAKDFESAQFAFGGPGTGEDEPYLDCTAWIGDIADDDGNNTYGLHLSCDECPEEGSVTLSSFSAPTPPKSASVPVERLEALLEQWDKCSANHVGEFAEANLAELIAEYK